MSTSAIEDIASLLPRFVPLDGLAQAVALWFGLDMIVPNITQNQKILIVGGNGAIHWYLHPVAARVQVCGGSL